MNEHNGFNPRNVKQYRGMICTTESGSAYCFTADGKVHRTGGRTSTRSIQIITAMQGYHSSEPQNIGPADIEGATARIIAGIGQESYEKITAYLAPTGAGIERYANDTSINDLIHRYGRPVTPGLHLVVAGTTPRSLGEGRTLYCLTSPIDTVEFEVDGLY